jgi:hypothetical protein
MIGGFNVIQGPAAIRVGRYWLGVASGNRPAKNLRRTPERAIKDAVAIEGQERKP